MVDIENLTEHYFSNNIPCPYKLKFGNEILIYPIKVKDYKEFERCVDILKVEKEKFNDERIISMSQLEFLGTILFQIEEKIEDSNVSIGYNEQQKFKGIFRYCLNEDYVIIAKDDNDRFVIAVYDYNEKQSNYILKYCITNKEFIEISKIILYQNFYDYSDEYVNPDVLEQYNEYIRLKSKNREMPTFERQKIFVLSRYGCKIEEINEMTYRLFSLLYNEYIDIEQYLVQNMYKTAYKYDVKEDVEYPLFKKKKDKFEDLFMSEQSLNNKLGNN